MTLYDEQPVSSVTLNVLRPSRLGNLTNTTTVDMAQLQRSIGNQTIGHLSRFVSHPVQREREQITDTNCECNNCRKNRISLQRKNKITTVAPVVNYLRPSVSKSNLVMRDFGLADPFPGGSDRRPPQNLRSCRAYLGGRFIDHWTGFLGFRHLYINVYQSPKDYALIEGGPIDKRTMGGISGAWVKDKDWSARGSHWNITPESNCSNFITCLKQRTNEYHTARHPYNARYGPNSNSFVWWALKRCGLDISTLISDWPYRGIDYWRTHLRRPQQSKQALANP